MIKSPEIKIYLFLVHQQIIKLSQDGKNGNRLLNRALLSEILEKQTTTLGLQNGELEKTDLVTAFLILCDL